MLKAAARLTKSQEFGLVVRRGRRAGRSRVVVHALLRDAGGPGETAPTWVPEGPTRVGFVVSKAVGNAVIRHRVSRQLRHVMRERLGRLPAGTLVVIRALPPAAPATSAELARDVDAALRKLRLPTGAWSDSTSVRNEPPVNNGESRTDTM